MQQANERTIQLKRCENQELREKYRKSLNDEHAGSILQLFNSRPKAEGLAIKRKTIKVTFPKFIFQNVYVSDRGG